MDRWIYKAIGTVVNIIDRGIYKAIGAVVIMFVLVIGIDQYKRPSMDNIQDYTVQLKQNFRGIGTGFAIGPRHILSAQHVCEEYLTHGLVGGKGYDVVIVKHSNYNATDGIDICIIEVDSDLKDYLDISTTDVEIGESVWGFGYPTGIGFKFKYKVTSDVIPSMSVKKQVFYLADGLAARGASGSPVLNDRGQVVGVLVGIVTQGPSRVSFYGNAVFLRLEYIKKFLEQDMIKQQLNKY